MAELKTKATNKNPRDFINNIEPDQKRADSFTLLDLFTQVSGEQAVMWGESIVGFGKYHYKSEKSRQEGDWPLVAFSPRKQNLTLYIMAGNKDNQALLKKLGKHKESKGCLYINKLNEVDLGVLEKLVDESFKYMKKTNQVVR
jgi:hypothetical protein